MTKNKAILELLLCSLLWSIGGVFMKLVPWSGFAIAGARGVLAAGVMAAFMAARRLRFTLTRRSALGGACLCGTMTLFALANKATTAANAIVLQYTAPIWIMLVSGALLHKRFRAADKAAAALTLLGIALCFADSLGAGGLAGNCIAVASGFCLACYYITLGDSPEDARMSSVLLAHLLTVLVGLPALVLERPPMAAAALLSVAVLGIFQLGVPYVLLAHASGWCSALVMSLVTALEPLLNPLWVALFNGEAPGPSAAAGAAVVVATVTAWCIYDKKHEEAAR